MARVVMFAYVLLAGLATPALMFAAGGDGAPPAATGAQATDPGATSTPAATTSTPAPAPTPAPVPAASAAPAASVSKPTPAPASSPAGAPARPRRASVVAARRPVKVRAVAHTAGSDTISDFKYTPGTVTVAVGESVTWTNEGPTGHSATADDGSFDTGVLSKGTTGSHTFTKAGTYTFHCTPHPFMHGTIVVTAASSGGGGGSGASSSGSGSGSGDTGTGTGSSAGTAGAGTGAGSSSSPSLAQTGADAGAVALLGAILLGGGMVLRRRLEHGR